MWDLTEFVTLVGVALFSGFSLSEEVKVVKKMLQLKCFFRIEFMTNICPKIFKSKPGNLKTNNFIFQKFIVLKQDYLKGKEAVVYFVIFKGK